MEGCVIALCIQKEVFSVSAEMKLVDELRTFDCVFLQCHEWCCYREMQSIIVVDAHQVCVLSGNLHQAEVHGHQDG